MSYDYPSAGGFSLENGELSMLHRRLAARNLSVFNHNLYEYQKGLRSMALVTEKKEYVELIKQRLEAKKIAYHISSIDKNTKTLNIFFGDSACIAVVASFGDRLCKLSSLDDQQDFILGTMLGYHPVEQSKRYMSRLNKNKQKQNIIK